MDQRRAPIYLKVKLWVDEYGKSGAEDSRAVSDFMDIESTELISSVRNELAAIASGNYDEKSLDQLVGPKRRDRHGSYQEWARLMLLWMASKK